MARPGSIPAIRRRPSQTTVMTPEPSSSSASRAGTPPRGRRVTVRSEPRSLTRSRLGASAIETCWDRSERAYSWRRWCASWLLGLAQWLIVWRSLLLLIGSTGLVGAPGLRRHGDLERLADRHRLRAAVHRDLADRVLPDRRLVRLHRRRAHQLAPQHPARAVDADHPGELLLASALADLEEQLGPPRALALGGRAAGLGDLGGDLRPDVGPEVAVARGG